MSVMPWLAEDFQRVLGRLLSGRLHHGLLINASAGMGKEGFADALAHSLLCQKPSSLGPCGHCQSCHLVAAGSHADFMKIESDKQIGVDRIREVIAKFTGTAQLGGNKVLIIPKADSMTEAASNALLKTLEEPTPNTYLLLLTEKLQALLPTILSRCEKLTLAKPSASQSLTWLQQQGVHDADEALLAAYGGAPLRVQAALAEGDQFTYADFQSGLETLLRGATSSLTLANKWQSNAQEIVRWCQMYVRDRHIEQQRSEQYLIYQQCIKASETLLHPGVNKVLVLNDVLLLLKQV